MLPDPAPVLASAEAFQRLLADPRSTHAELLSARATAPVWQEVLARFPHSAVWVAANRALPLEIVEHLASHPSLPVRAALATSGRVPEAVMMQLAHDKSELIRLRVVCNALVSRGVLAALTNDPCRLVAAHAQARLVHDISGVALPPSYLDEVEVLALLH